MFLQKHVRRQAELISAQQKCLSKKTISLLKEENALATKTFLQQQSVKHGKESND